MTRIILDTHALLWWASGNRALGGKARRLIENQMVTVLASAVVAWEISTKVRLGRLTWTANESVEAYCLGQRFILLPITLAHADRAGSWPVPHGDPFDRMLAAQSQIERAPLVTNDAMMRAFGIDTIW